MGVFYVGYDWRNRKNGYFKIGESSKDTPSQRVYKIRRTDAFDLLDYLVLINDTKVERLFVESYVRLKIEQNIQELSHTQNDHFLYRIEEGRKEEQAKEFAQKVIEFAQEGCKIINLEYKIGTKKYKKG